LLITPGICEERGLASSLKRTFPDAGFTSIRLDGFTSEALKPEPELGGDPATNLEKLAAELVAAVEPGERGKPADLVFLIDDLELKNSHQPQVAIHHMREAVRAHLERHPWRTERSRQRAVERIRERCSFHLLSPMLEAYFFGEPAGLRRAEAIREAIPSPR